MTGGFDPPLTDGSASSESTVRLLLSHDRNRELLADWLDEEYDVVVGSPAGLSDSDLCLVDDEGFLDHREAIQDWKEAIHPRFAPVVLVTEQTVSEDLEPEAWADIDGLYVVDEVVTLPAEKSVLGRRLENLLERRSLSERLASQYERSEQRFASLFHATPDPAVVLDDDAAIQYVNDAFCSTVGLDRETVVGESLEALSTFDAGTIGQLQDAASRAMAGDTVADLSLVFETADGALRHAELSVRDTTVGDRSGAVLVFHDVTERVERERELERSERRFREIASHVNEVIWMLPPDASDLLYMSPGVEDLVGMEPGEITDPVAPFLDCAHEDDRADFEAWVESSLADIAAGGENAPYSTTLRLHSPSGLRWIQIDGYPVFEDGDIERLVGLIDDITETKERERELRQQNERLEEFTSIVSHDLRNPLQVVKSRAELLDGADQESVDSIRGAAERMEELIADLLDLARHGDTIDDIELLDVGTVATDAWDLVTTGSATVSVDADATVEADPNRLQQLFENLFRNAVEHGGPNITVTVGTILQGFYVEDDGPGIPEGERDAVFEHGYSTTEDGTGFGLQIVADIAEAHGWDVRVTESDAGGARFEITGVDFL
jgi:PAS domain S-box-containing protein